VPGGVIPFLDLRVADGDDEIRSAVLGVMASGSLILGPEVDAFEGEFAAYCGTSHCVGVGSGTSAIELVLRAMDIGPGDEVLVPAYTAIATWMAVTEVGATPVGVDVDDTYSMDPAAAAAARTKRCRAAIAVHLLGRPMDLAALEAAVPGLPIIEDCAQAHGARCGAVRVGATGIAGTFSFYPTKNLGALGDGGAIVTSDADLADRVRLLRAFGWRERSASLVKAGNSRLDEIQAAALRVRLRRLDTANEHRQALAAALSDHLANTPDVTLPTGASWSESVWHLYVIRVADPVALSDALTQRGVGSLRHYDPLPHQTTAFVADQTSRSFPGAERLARESLSLPMGLHLDSGDMASVAELVKASLADLPAGPSGAKT
jgi:dTDP-4-amino-4,6-dideoxygalactose transaminase